MFFELRHLEVGDEIAVTRNDASTPRFRVPRVEQFAKDAFPAEAGLRSSRPRRAAAYHLRRSFDRQARSYTDNIVVFADSWTTARKEWRRRIVSGLPSERPCAAAIAAIEAYADPRGTNGRTTRENAARSAVEESDPTGSSRDVASSLATEVYP